MLSCPKLIAITSRSLPQHFSKAAAIQRRQQGRLPVRVCWAGHALAATILILTGACEAVSCKDFVKSFGWNPFYQQDAQAGSHGPVRRSGCSRVLPFGLRRQCPEVNEPSFPKRHLGAPGGFPVQMVRERVAGVALTGGTGVRPPWSSGRWPSACSCRGAVHVHVEARWTPLSPLWGARAQCLRWPSSASQRAHSRYPSPGTMALRSGLLRSPRQKLRLVLEGFAACSPTTRWCGLIRSGAAWPSKFRLFKKTDVSKLRAALKAAFQKGAGERENKNVLWRSSRYREAAPFSVSSGMERGVSHPAACCASLQEQKHVNASTLLASWHDPANLIRTPRRTM